ncbi:pyridoxamine 5'-phosphate oxidase family protein [Halovenus sp. WSH3]|uniref:Pyridoxamine 5'-phosphate oxidase family protein n=1 Tax=Halovenus carboxidivorans TaxID=2692199 RepID=A0A6B0T793_9EURY|nr:pyridoxamine 5'-phosphate oxidase family protein [Halovenus carboxidivorans]MXR52076.1 pyridoxamine 5'-phosphate oxidase family protein [Halovenus carboxidivorans]
MSLAQETEMSATEIDEFLSGAETGVLALARDNEPYSIPISYGYDAETRAFYMRLVSTPDSDKRRFLSSEPQARLVIYDENEPQTRYRSVLATGTLEQIEPDEMSVEEIEQYGEARRPLFEIWGAGKDELDIKLYRLEPEELTGRRTEVDRDF